MNRVLKRSCWKWMPIAALLLGTTACDSSYVDEAQDASLDQEIAASVAFISDDLGFTAAETTILQNSFAESDDFSHEAGFLWRVAARLQENLTEQQRERLMNRFESQGDVFGAPGFQFGLGQGFDHRFQTRRGFGPWGQYATAGAFADHLGLDEQQKDAIRQIISDAKDAMRSLRDQHAAGDLSNEAFREALHQLMENTRTAWENELTVDQKAILEQMRADREEALLEREQLREQDRAAARAVMIEVLGLTEDQVLRLDALHAMVADLREAFQALIDTGATREEVKEWAEGARTDVKTELADILEPTQLEIFLIHGALDCRVGLRFQQMRDGGPGGHMGPH